MISWRIQVDMLVPPELHDDSLYQSSLEQVAWADKRGLSDVGRRIGTRVSHSSGPLLRWFCTERSRSGHCGVVSRGMPAVGSNARPSTRPLATHVCACHERP